MSLTVGARLGQYEIVAPLGAGGMGEVYRDRDTKLGRDVAIKILPDAFAADLDRIARFEREAQLLAALNHPHIAAIYGLEESNAIRFLVLDTRRALPDKAGHRGEHHWWDTRSRPQYAVSPDGRFLMNVNVDEGTASPITIVMNWDAALRK